MSLLLLLRAPGTTQVTTTRPTSWGMAPNYTGRLGTAAASPANLVPGYVEAVATTQVTATRLTTWVTGTTVVSLRSTTWVALSAAAVTRATTWATTAPVVKATSTTWSVAGVLTAVTTTRSTTWVARAQTAATRLTTWATANAVVKATASTWTVTATAVVTRATTWVTATTAAKPTSSTWAVATSVTTTSPTSWAVASNAVAGFYTGRLGNILSRLGNVVLGYVEGVAPATTPVTTNRATTWQTRTVSATTRTATWVTTTNPTATRITTWSVAAPPFTPVLKTVVTTWNVAGVRYRFTTPNRRVLHGTGQMWGRINDTESYSVIKEGSVYRTTESPSSEEMALATLVYLGGYDHTVSAAEAAALTAAGYGAGITVT